MPDEEIRAGYDRLRAALANEGIDGIIKEDRFGLDTIYVQAKRWQGTVGRPEIQRFAGALQGQRARSASNAFSQPALPH